MPRDARQRRVEPVDRRRRVRLVAGLVAVTGGLALIGSTFLGWISTAMDTGGRTTISGWGTISGGSSLVDGANFNTLMAGVGSYRPAVPVVIAGAVTVIPGLIVAVTGAGRRPSRVIGALLAACGLVATGWSVAKLVDPGDAVGVLPDGQGSAGAGPLLAAVAGLALLLVAGSLLAGLLDPSGARDSPGMGGARAASSPGVDRLGLRRMPRPSRARPARRRAIRGRVRRWARARHDGPACGSELPWDRCRWRRRHRSLLRVVEL